MNSSKSQIMQKLNLAVCFGLLAFHCAASAVLGITGPSDNSQDEYERSISSVVRNKLFYKSGKIELGFNGGIMPYDSLVNHYLAGGRLTWHFSDHYGWEVIDAMLTFPTTTSFTTNLVSSKGISNLQTTRLNMLFSSNFLLSPIYGKMRFFGSSVLHYDLYVVAGLGAANNDTLKVSTPGTAQPATELVLRSGFNPMFDFGLGFKIFINRAMGLVFDMRDYVVYAPVYGTYQLKSNFSVALGLSFFLPTF